MQGESGAEADIRIRVRADVIGIESERPDTGAIIPIATAKRQTRIRTVPRQRAFFSPPIILPISSSLTATG